MIPAQQLARMEEVGARCGHCCPNHTSEFKISVDGGSDFDHTHPVVEPNNPAHTYQYRVTVQGLPVRIMLEENSARGDDYGTLQMRVAGAG